MFFVFLYVEERFQLVFYSIFSIESELTKHLIIVNCLSIIEYIILFSFCMFY